MFNRRLIEDYIIEYEEFKPKIISRELKVPLETDFIISIIGPRRAGKTYYLLQLRRRSNGLYLNFEDSRLLGISHRELRDIIRIYIDVTGKTPRYLYLDEVQNLKGWEIIVREIHDLKKYRIIITGSSSKLLSREIATQLRGRTLSYILLPFSFREYLRAKGIHIKDHMSLDEEAKLRNSLREYLEYGGFPEVVLCDEKLRILKEYSDLILFRDFIERHSIRNIDLARFLHTYLIQNIAREITVKSIYNKLKSMNVRVSKDTMYRYMQNIQDTVFFFLVKKYSEKIHLRESWPKKVYIADVGLIKVHGAVKDLGKIIENTVFLELIQKNNENPLLEIYYWKNPVTKREVDFVVKKGSNIKQLIQVTYELRYDDREHYSREVKSLLEASRKLKCNDLLIITWDQEEEIKENSKRIILVPLWKWLLQSNLKLKR